MAHGTAAPAEPARWWRDRRYFILLALGFSAGVPLPLVAGQVLRQWFAESGLSLGAIGLTALIGDDAVFLAQPRVGLSVHEAVTHGRRWIAQSAATTASGEG